MNKVFLIGNLTRDPEMSETGNGTLVCHFGIAVNRSYSSQDSERQADFFECTAWRGTAESVGRYCKKGNKVAVTGSVQIRNYEDNHGNRRTAVDIIVQDVEFLMQREKRDDFYGDAARESAGSAPRQARQLSTFDDFDDDGDIPF